MLIDYLPTVVQKIREMKEICIAEQPEFDSINREIDRLLANRFISKADEEGIEQYEKELGIVPMPGQSLEERRIAVLLKTRKKNLSFKNIINLIRNYSETIDLLPDYDKEELNVITSGTKNIDMIYDTLDEIIALNITIHISTAESGHEKIGTIWQDDEIFNLKEAAL